jgi:hypothetical protein
MEDWLGYSYSSILGKWDIKETILSNNKQRGLWEW